MYIRVKREREREREKESERERERKQLVFCFRFLLHRRLVGRTLVATGKSTFSFFLLCL